MKRLSQKPIINLVLLLMLVINTGADAYGFPSGFQRCDVHCVQEDRIEFSYRIVSVDVYEKFYSHLPWMHIGRISKLNKEIDLKHVNAETDFSEIEFNQSLDFVYRLYDGNYLVRTIK